MPHNTHGTSKHTSHRCLMAADLMQLPLDERRRLLAIQTKEMAVHYAATTDEREAWQGGDVVEY